MTGRVIEEAEVRYVRLPLREPLEASHGTVTERPLTLVRLSDGETEGWGECGALPQPTYTDEFAAGAHLLLRDHLVPRLMGVEATPAAVARVLAPVLGGPMAKAAVDMAATDLALRRAGRSLASAWAVPVGSVAAGAVTGLAPSPDVLVARVTALAAAGYRRVKIKIEPGRDVEPIAAVRAALPHLELHVDANGAYDPLSVDALRRLDDLGVACVEQPFPLGAEAAAATLDGRLAATVALDESVVSPAAGERLLEAGFRGALVLKPARLGGLEAAKRLHDLSLAAGAGLIAGGLLESGIGRRALVTLAALPGCRLVGDVSPPDRWFTDDIAAPLELLDGCLAVPDGPGLGVVPDPAALDRLTVETRRFG